VARASATDVAKAWTLPAVLYTSAEVLRFELDTDSSEEQIATLLKLTERYCVVAQSLRQSPTFSISRRA